MGLSGGMVWALENDDFMDRCGGGKNPLLNRVHAMLNGNDKDSHDCPIDDEVITTVTPSTPTPTTHTPSTQTPSTQTPSTHSPSTQSPTPKATSPPSQTTLAVTPFTAKIGNQTIECFKSGYISHPLNRHKYIFCEYIAEGPQQGWWIHIMDCSPGTRWHQPTENCIQDESFFYADHI